MSDVDAADVPVRGGALAGIAVAAVIFLADQASKLWVLSVLPDNGPIHLAPFLDLTLVWNRGISYGLMQQDGIGRWLLVAATVAASAGLGVWLLRARRAVVRIGLGAIVGGALGNLVDRIAYGAVVDFVHLHVGGFSWYVFNLADAAIVVGVAALVVDGLFVGRPATAA